jgi:hypothetical protein
MSAADGVESCATLLLGKEALVTGLVGAGPSTRNGVDGSEKMKIHVFLGN